MAKDLAMLREKRTIFTLTMHEWTWRRKKSLGMRSMRPTIVRSWNNITRQLHSSARIPLFDDNSVQLLSRFREHANAKSLEKALLDVLADVRLSIKNISGITTDGAAVMKKLGTSLVPKLQERENFARKKNRNSSDLQNIRGRQDILLIKFGASASNFIKVQLSTTNC